MVYQKAQIDLTFIILIQITMKSKRICSYRISNELIGEGSFSQVYLAYSHKQEKVAVKIIPRNKIIDNQMQVFQSEISLLSKCKNQYIIDFIDVKKTKANFYIFLEYCQGGNLAEYISKHNQIQEREAMRIFSQIVKGMNAMKKKNVIHRDLKPANIMLKGKSIKIVDFGLARKYSKGQMLRTYAGTPLNMAPQILKGELYNDKADVYSVGTILYEMLFGVLPFHDQSVPGLLKKIQNSTKCNNLFSHLPKKTKISSAIKQLLIKMLQPNPQKRIEFSDLMMEVRKWQKSKTDERLNNYKRLSAGAIPYMAILGGLASIFQFDFSKVKQRSIYDFDLKLCGKLSQKLISKELEWLKNIDLIRV